MHYKKRKRLVAVPLKPLHIYTTIWPERDALCLQKRSLFGPAGYQPSGVIHYTVTGEIAIKFCVTEHLAHQSGIFLPANEYSNLSVRAHLACRDFRHDREYFIGQLIIQSVFHRTFNI